MFVAHQRRNSKQGLSCGRAKAAALIRIDNGASLSRYTACNSRRAVSPSGASRFVDLINQRLLLCYDVHLTSFLSFLTEPIEPFEPVDFLKGILPKGRGVWWLAHAVLPQVEILNGLEVWLRSFGIPIL